MSLSERVREAFSADQTENFSERFIEYLLSNWRQAEEKLRTTTLLLLLSACGFELLVRADVSELTLAGAEIRDLTFVVKVLPAIYSYFLYEVASYSLATLNYQRLFNAVLEQLHPALRREGFNEYLEPAVVSLWGEWSLTGAAQGAAASAVNVTIGLKRRLFVLVALVIWGYMVFRLVSDFSQPDLVVIVSLLGSALSMLHAALVGRIGFSRSYTKGCGSSWILGPCLTCANALG
jgi:hypothetical protein